MAFWISRLRCAAAHDPEMFGLTQVPRVPAEAGPLVFSICTRLQAKLARSQMKNPPAIAEGLVPETGFEPARRFQRHHLKVVRLPISPPGQIEI